MILVSKQEKKLTFEKFFAHYKQLIEERLLQDVNIGSANLCNPIYDSLKKTFAMLMRMNADPLHFLDDAFYRSDGIPNIWQLNAMLKYYRGDDVYPSFNFRLKLEIRRVKNLARGYKKLYELFFVENINPFLAIYDDDIKFFVWNDVLPIRLAHYEKYFEQLKCAFYLIDDYSYLKKKLKKEWLPVLRSLTKKRKRI